MDLPVADTVQDDGEPSSLGFRDKMVRILLFWWHCAAAQWANRQRRSSLQDRGELALEQLASDAAGHDTQASKGQSGPAAAITR